MDMLEGSKNMIDPYLSWEQDRLKKLEENKEIHDRNMAILQGVVDALDRNPLIVEYACDGVKYTTVANPSNTAYHVGHWPSVPGYDIQYFTVMEYEGKFHIFSGTYYQYPDFNTASVDEIVDALENSLREHLMLSPNNRFKISSSDSERWDLKALKDAQVFLKDNDIITSAITKNMLEKPYYAYMAYFSCYLSVSELENLTWVMSLSPHFTRIKKDSESIAFIPIPDQNNYNEYNTTVYTRVGDRYELNGKCVAHDHVKSSLYKRLIELDQ